MANRLSINEAENLLDKLCVLNGEIFDQFEGEIPEEEKEKMENECIAELIGSILIPRMIEVIRKGGYDGKSTKDRRRGVEILEMLESGMENMQIDKLNVRFLFKII